MADEKPRTGLPDDIDWRAFTPDDSPRTPQDLFSDPAVQDLAAAKLAVGDPAEDFELPVLDFSDGSGRPTGQVFQLRKVAAERPVALVFGSYT